MPSRCGCEAQIAGNSFRFPSSIGDGIYVFLTGMEACAVAPKGDGNDKESDDEQRYSECVGVNPRAAYADPCVAARLCG